MQTSNQIGTPSPIYQHNEHDFIGITGLSSMVVLHDLQVQDFAGRCVFRALVFCTEYAFSSFLSQVPFEYGFGSSIEEQLKPVFSLIPAVISLVGPYPSILSDALVVSVYL